MPNKTNDRPIRLYGVIPLKVTDPATKLAPVVTTAAEWKPAGKASIQVSRDLGPRHELHAGGGR